MQLSTKSRYGLRAMVELARHHGDGALALREIAEEEQLSWKYLENLFNSLKVAGLLISRRGPRGGWRLARDPVQIRVSEIMQALEGVVDVVPCVADPDSCDRLAHCPTRDFYVELNDAILAVYNHYTLEDLLQHRLELGEFVPKEGGTADLCRPDPTRNGHS